MKRKIAIDIDDVLAASAEAFVAWSNERWGMSLTVDDYEEHWGRMWQLEHDREEAERRADEFHEAGVVGRHRPHEEALPVLKELGDEYDLVIITSRRRSIAAETEEWLKVHYAGVFSEVHFAGMWDSKDPDRLKATKTEVCRQIGADYLVDDQLKHCLAAAEAGIPAVLFGRYAWNRADKLPHNVTRCEKWEQVRDYFKER